MVRVVRPNTRKDKDKVLDQWRIVEVREKIMQVTYALMEDEHYSKELSIKELKNISEMMFHVEKERLELENHYDNAMAAYNEAVNNLLALLQEEDRKSATDGTAAQL